MSRQNGDGTEVRVDQNEADDKALNWQEYFMSLAFLTSLRSISEPQNMKVGACIISPENKVVSTGFNGLLDNDKYDVEAKQALEDAAVCHAVYNAVINKEAVDVKGCFLYTTHFPCNECTKLIIQSRIERVVYASDQNTTAEPNIEASRQMFQKAGVGLSKFTLTKEVTLDFKKFDSNPTENWFK